MSVLRRALSAVQDGKDDQAVLPHTVWDDVGSVRYNQFTCPGSSTWTPKVGVSSEQRNSLADGGGDISSSLRPVLFDVGLKIGEMPYRLVGPDYLHEGGATFRFLPQDLSHGSTFSCGTTRPASASRSPSSISDNCHCCSATYVRSASAVSQERLRSTALANSSRRVLRSAGTRTVKVEVCPIIMCSPVYIIAHAFPLSREPTDCQLSGYYATPPPRGASGRATCQFPAPPR